ncbi:hypothetical protein BU23DRAFT_575143 [Bimuria novae-zelandiae CBS 107.79]|uniref:Uncharacterized protein n=1 Tax=Bimuria novae-zelandiae CBS 107.79 TaxID=1447943 RepID=A0A6A5UL93_9PLEO|nr:hypothetical protein BU23DRAFT_575143 [Bimuria novae-zelandiae CBS 107.79]
MIDHRRTLFADHDPSADMIEQTIFLGALALVPSIVLSTPVETLGSKHTVFLASCTPSDCPIDLCDPAGGMDAPPVLEHMLASCVVSTSGAGHFVNGPPSGSTASATAYASTSSTRWEGVSRSLKFSRYGTFKTSIDAKAGSLAKGEIAGSATLTARDGGTEAEPFLCFKDGSTKFRAKHDGDWFTCTAAYYCPTVDAGTTPLGTLPE